MGITCARITFRRDQENSDSMDLDCLVDSGADYTVVPRKLLRQLKITPSRSITIILGDGTKCKRDVESASFRF